MWTFLTILFALICLFMAVFPRGYWLMQASGYKNPEAHEPSDGTVAFTRVLGIVTLVVLVFIFIPAAIEHDQKPAETTTNQQTREEPEPTPEQTCEKDTFLCLED
jgi:hypothetical protein